MGKAIIKLIAIVAVVVAAVLVWYWYSKPHTPATGAASKVTLVDTSGPITTREQAIAFGTQIGTQIGKDIGAKVGAQTVVQAAMGQMKPTAPSPAAVDSADNAMVASAQGASDADIPETMIGPEGTDGMTATDAAPADAAMPATTAAEPEPAADDMAETAAAEPAADDMAETAAAEPATDAMSDQAGEDAAADAQVPDTAADMPATTDAATAAPVEPSPADAGTAEEPAPASATTPDTGMSNDMAPAEEADAAAPATGTDDSLPVLADNSATSPAPDSKPKPVVDKGPVRKPELPRCPERPQSWWNETLNTPVRIIYIGTSSHEGDVGMVLMSGSKLAADAGSHISLTTLAGASVSTQWQLSDNGKMLFAPGLKLGCYHLSLSADLASAEGNKLGKSVEGNIQLR